MGRKRNSILLLLLEKAFGQGRKEILPVSLFLPAAQPTGQGKGSVLLLLLLLLVGVTTFHTTVS